MSADELAVSSDGAGVDAAPMPLPLPEMLTPEVVVPEGPCICPLEPPFLETPMLLLPPPLAPASPAPALAAAGVADLWVLVVLLWWDRALLEVRGWEGGSAMPASPSSKLSRSRSCTFSIMSSSFSARTPSPEVADASYALRSCWLAFDSCCTKPTASSSLCASTPTSMCVARSSCAFTDVNDSPSGRAGPEPTCSKDARSVSAATAPRCCSCCCWGWGEATCIPPSDMEDVRGGPSMASSDPVRGRMCALGVLGPPDSKASADPDRDKALGPAAGAWDAAAAAAAAAAALAEGRATVAAQMTAVSMTALLLPAVLMMVPKMLAMV
mmetsp:Transcript_8788/g.22120  ORF Transcript_8788/g.22120 Transcript_8788/m.22120 type:complete len:326 (-) Transcript_8788:32-1009(-)